LHAFLLARARQYSCKSLMVTFFGDIASVHGHWIWLGDVIRLLKPLGYSERLVRTSAFRLVQENWLHTQKVGRQSFYAVTERAQHIFTQAEKRVYNLEGHCPQNRWLLVFLEGVEDQAKREALRKELRWLGFNRLSPGLWGHPAQDASVLESTLSDLELEDKVVIFDASLAGEAGSEVLTRWVQQRWQLAELNQEYVAFIQLYAPFCQYTAADWSSFCEQHPLSIIGLRLLLVHEFRRILLRDYDLPQDMLPDDWQGHKARQTLANLYLQLARPSSQFLSDHLSRFGETKPEVANEFFSRFVQ